ncbi:hypothetical protein K4K51_013034 [Colletotrichum sp. SAR 10_75]|nr:hypothetical protein K4K51_013034 [Colletotrichum sp. SAR 10_75]
MDPNTSVEDQQFEELLRAFEDAHGKRKRSLKAHMDEVMIILESQTEGLRQTMNVKHTPISARLKDADKALQTLRRRQEDRKKLRELKGLVENRGQKWEEYCKEWSMEDKITEVEPFTNIDQMFEAMHDLAGIRISVYFPADVPRVVEFFRGDRFIIAEQPSRKGGLKRDFQKIRRLVERQREIHDVPENKLRNVERMENTGVPEATFAGYKATHVVIRLRDPNFDTYVASDPIINIEVQIGSIIMHAWSDIEHDILYKPSEVNQVSADAVQMLDLINGIVMTGEVALQQLTRVGKAEADRQLAARTRRADSWHDMVTWSYKYFKANYEKGDIPEVMDLSARYLFEILKTTDQHTNGRVEDLLHKVNPEPLQKVWPFELLCNVGLEKFHDPSFQNPRHATTMSARYWATCLVNMANLALYMRCSVFSLMGTHAKEAVPDEERPTFAEFLEILHPTKPQHRAARDGLMIDFCKLVLNTKFAKSDAKAAVRLAAAGYVVRPPLSKEDEKNLRSQTPVCVPAILNELTQDPGSSFEITLSLIGDNVRYDKSQYFIPSKESNTWKPARREADKTWSITKTQFTIDETLVFTNTKAQWEAFSDRLCDVLGVSVDTYSEEVCALHHVALRLNFKGVEDNELWMKKLRDVSKITSALGTKDPETVYQFLQMSGGIEDAKDFRELVKLGALARDLNTMDPEELKVYLDLARSYPTRDADELRALKRLADRHDTRDPVELDKWRMKEKEGS